MQPIQAAWKDFRRLLSAALALILLLTNIPFSTSALVTVPEDVTFMSGLTIGGDTTIAGSGVEWTVLGKKAIQGSATSVFNNRWIQSEGSITLTNTSGQTKMLEISYTKSSGARLIFEDGDGNKTTYQTSGVATTVTGTYTNDSFDAGEVLTISFKNESGANDGVYGYLYLTNITLTEAGEKTLTFLPDPVGLSTYTVGETQIAPGNVGTSVTVNYGDEITATFDSSEKNTLVLGGWHWRSYDDAGNLTDEGYYSVGQTAITAGSSATVKAKTTCTLEPVFVSAEYDTAPLRVAGEYWWDWETAFAVAAQNDKRVVQTANFQLPAYPWQNGMTGETLEEASGTYVTYHGTYNNAICWPVYHIPEGFTYLMPRAAGSETVRSDLPYANYVETEVDMNSSVTYDGTSSTDRNVLLIVPNMRTVQADGGKLILGGTINGEGYAGACIGARSNISLGNSGAIRLKSGSVFSAVGYVYGGGTITAESGSAIYTPFVVYDYYGGGYTASAANTNSTEEPYASYYAKKQSSEAAVTPFMRYGTHSLKADVTMEQGAYMYGYVDMYAGYAHRKSVVNLVGDDNQEALIKLANGATMTADHDNTCYAHVTECNSTGGHSSTCSYRFVGRTTLAINGGGSMGTIKMHIELGSYASDVDMGILSFPVPYNYNIQLINGSYSIPNSAMLLPGATMEVGSDAVLNVTGERFMVYDGLFDQHFATDDKDTITAFGQNYQAVPFHYPRTADLQSAGLSGTAQLIVNGELNIGDGVKFGGLIQTTGTGTVNTSETMTAECDSQIGLMKTKDTGEYTTDYLCGASVATLPAQLMMTAGDNTLTTIVPGESYTGTYTAETDDHALESYTHVFFNQGYSVAGNIVSGYTFTWSETPLTRTLTLNNAPVYGTWSPVLRTGTLILLNSTGTQFGTAEIDEAYDLTDVYTDEACTTAATAAVWESEGEVVLYAKVVAQVDWAAESKGDAYYPALQTAINAVVNAGDKVIVLEDLTLTETLTVAQGQDMILDLNGKTLTSSALDTLSVESGATAEVTSCADTKGVLHNTTESTTETAVADFSAAIRNAGTLRVSNVEIKRNDAGNRTGITNLSGGTISSISDVVITVGKTENGYGLLNYGTVEEIGNADITAYNGIYASRGPITTIGVDGSTVSIDAENYGICAYGAVGKIGTIGASGSYVEINSANMGIWVYYNGSVETIGEKPKSNEIEYTVVINAKNGIYVQASSGTTTNIDTIGSVKAVATTAAVYLVGGSAEGKIAKITNIGLEGAVTYLEGQYGIFGMNTENKIEYIGAAGDVRIKGTNSGIYLNHSGSITSIGNGGQVEIYALRGIMAAPASGDTLMGTVTGIYDGTTIICTGTADRYAVQTDRVAVTTFYGGYFYHKTASSYTDRDYTIMNPDDQSYADGGSLSTQTTPVVSKIDGKTYNCYYVIGAHTHEYPDTSDCAWTVNDDGTANVTATLTCTAADCGESLTATVENVAGVTETATCGEDGSITYTTNVTLDGNTYEVQHSEILAATGYHITDDNNDLICDVCGNSTLDTPVYVGNLYQDAWQTQRFCAPYNFYLPAGATITYKGPDTVQMTIVNCTGQGPGAYGSFKSTWKIPTSYTSYTLDAAGWYGFIFKNADGSEITGDPGLLSEYISICLHTNVVTDAAKDASCTATGLTEGSHCGDCGMTLTVQQTLSVSLAGKYVSILGDSISSFEGISNDASLGLGNNLAHYPRADGPEMTAADTYWMQLINNNDMLLCVNNSYSGSYLTQGADNKAGLARSSNLHNATTGQMPDIIVVYIGINDMNNSVTAETTGNVYKEMLAGMSTNYPDAHVFCVGMPNTIGDDTAAIAYNEQIAAAVEAAGEKFHYVDLFSSEMSDEIYLACSYDGLHPNAKGMDYMTDVITKAITEVFNGHTEVVDESVEPTCTATGLTEGSHCSVCGKTLTVQQTLSVSLAGKYVSILGDSISTYEGVSNDAELDLGSNRVYYPNRYLMDQNDTYWMQLINNNDMVLCVNNSSSGSLLTADNSSTSGLKRSAYLHNTVTGQKPDIIIVYIGYNDMNTGVLAETAGGVYKEMLAGMSTNYPDAHVFCVGLPNTTINDDADTIAYNEQIAAAVKASGEKFHYVDLFNSALKDEVYSENSYKGGIHPTETGMDYMTDVITKAITEVFNGHTYVNGVCTVCGDQQSGENATMEMLYDDRVDMTGKTVEIGEQNVTSYQVGHGVAEGTKDTAVVTLVDNTLVATGIGTATVVINGTTYEVTVKPAPISLLLLIGQSNAEGIDGDAEQSIVCPDGQVYSTYGEHGTLTKDNAGNFVASALSGTYSTTNVNGTADNLSGHPINSLTEDGAGKIGMDSGIAYEWVQQTGEKVWIVNAAHSGTGIAKWQPGASEYEQAVALFTACQETLAKEIAAGHYTLSHMGYFWCQGCNDAEETAEWYVAQYRTMHDGFKSELSFDHDGDASTEEAAVEFAGIIPIRGGSSTSVGYRDGEFAETDKKYNITFQDLRFTGPRLAQYWMGNNPELSDIWNVCIIGDQWVYMPDGTNGVSDYFQAQYTNGTVDYTTQVEQDAAWYTPTTPEAVHPGIHYKQIGYNEIGREAARNTLIMLAEITAPESETTVEFLSWDGYTPVSDISAWTDAQTNTLVVPVVNNLWDAKNVTYTLTDDLTYDYYDLLASTTATTGTLTAVGAEGTVTVHSYTVTFTWAADFSTCTATFTCSCCGSTEVTCVVEDDAVYDSENQTLTKYRVATAMLHGTVATETQPTGEPMTAVALVQWAEEGTSDTYYATLQAAVDAAVNAGDKVVVLTDIDLTGTVTVAAGQNIIIDLNGYTISNTIVGNTLVNNGTLVLTGPDGAVGSGGKIIGFTGSDNKDMTAAVNNTGTLTLSNISLLGDTDVTNYNYFAGLYNTQKGKVQSINNVKIDVRQGGNNYGITSYGEITSIDNTDITANYGIYVRYSTGKIGTIGMSGNVSILGNNTGIYFNDSGTIGTIGEGATVEISAQNGILAADKGGIIEGIYDGTIVVSTVGTKYAVDTTYLAVTTFYGGYYCNKKVADSSAGTIESADTQTYPEGMTLSSYTVPITSLSDPTQPYGCYFIAPTNAGENIILDALSLTNRSETQLNMKFHIPQGLLTENFTVTVDEQDNKVETYETVVLTLSDLAALQDDYGRYVITRGIAAGEMTGDVTVTFKNGDTVLTVYDSSYPTADPETAVVRTVTDYVALANVHGSDELKAMCEAMLVFGGRAQLFYGTNTDLLADKDITGLSLDAVNKDVLAPLLENVGDTGDIGIQVASQLVNLDSNVKLRVFFELEQNHSLNEYTFSLNFPIENGAARDDDELTATTTGSGCYIELDVPPAYWNDDYVITVAAGETTYTVTTNVMAWVYSCISENSGATEQEQNMAKAMYYYSMYADAYFATKQ